MPVPCLGRNSNLRSARRRGLVPTPIIVTRKGVNSQQCPGSLWGVAILTEGRASRRGHAREGLVLTRLSYCFGILLADLML